MTKESVYRLDKRVVFRETFNSESDTRSKGGTPTNVTFSNGIGEWDGTNGQTICYNPNLANYAKGEAVSVRVRFKQHASGSVALVHKWNTTGYMMVITSTQVLRIYGDGENKSSTGTFNLNEWNEAVFTINTSGEPDYYLNGANLAGTKTAFTAISKTNNDFAICEDTGGFADFDGEIELLEVYDKELTANEVALLYEDSLYREPHFSNEVLSIDSRNGGIADRYGNTLTNTAVEIVRDGSIYTQKYDGAGSKLDCGSDLIGTGDVTVMAWIRPFTYGEVGFGRILDNGRTVFYIDDANDRLLFTSNGFSNIVLGGSNEIKINGKYKFVVATRTSTGIANLYVDGVLSGTANQSSGTPVAGTTNSIVGNNNGSANTFDGYISPVKVIQGILSTKQITQYYNATKHYFNK